MRVRSGSQMLDAKEPPLAAAAPAQTAAGWARMAASSDMGPPHSRFGMPDRTFSFGEFSLTPARQLLLRNGAPIRLGSRALTILTALVERRGELVTRDELMAIAWPKLFVHESNLKVTMANLRRSLGDTQKAPIYVATVIGRGYRFVASVEIGAPASIERNVEPELAVFSGLPPAREIVGRDEEIGGIVTELRKEKHIGVVGTGGIGKATVAIAAARTADPGPCTDFAVRLVKVSLTFWFAIALLSEALTRVEEALNRMESLSDDIDSASS